MLADLKLLDIKQLEQLREQLDLELKDRREVLFQESVEKVVQAITSLQKNFPETTCYVKTYGADEKGFDVCCEVDMLDTRYTSEMFEKN